MVAALCCIATMIIKIPSPLKGYVNLGDCIVLLSGFTFSPVYGFLAAAIGSALADVFSGYLLYAPATFFIKGIMALIAHYGFKLLNHKAGKTASRIISATVAELVMVMGYFIFEGFLYGFLASTVNILPNAFQGVAGIVLGILLAKLLDKHKILQ